MNTVRNEHPCCFMTNTNCWRLCCEFLNVCFKWLKMRTKELFYQNFVKLLTENMNIILRSFYASYQFTSPCFQSCILETKLFKLFQFFYRQLEKTYTAKEPACTPLKNLYFLKTHKTAGSAIQVMAYHLFIQRSYSHWILIHTILWWSISYLWITTELQ